MNGLKADYVVFDESASIDPIDLSSLALAIEVDRKILAEIYPKAARGPAGGRRWRGRMRDECIRGRHIACRRNGASTCSCVCHE